MSSFAQKIMGVVMALGLVALLSLPAFAATEAPKSATAYFVNLQDGDAIQNGATIKFGSTGLTIEPAGVIRPGAGHFHLLIDTTLSAAQMNRPIPNDNQHLHFGKGQTETILNLTPGPHTLQLVMGDGAHVPHIPPVMSKVITVTVK